MFSYVHSSVFWSHNRSLRLLRWRNVLTISDTNPTDGAIIDCVNTLAKSAVNLRGRASDKTPVRYAEKVRQPYRCQMPRCTLCRISNALSDGIETLYSVSKGV